MSYRICKRCSVITASGFFDPKGPICVLCFDAKKKTERELAFVGLLTLTIPLAALLMDFPWQAAIFVLLFGARSIYLYLSPGWKKGWVPLARSLPVLAAICGVCIQGFIVGFSTCGGFL